ncbi:PREDICTED: ataxin-7-like protein 1 [Cyphomyrmex costatus]|uniref:Ataxin-7-like protein 2 n=1 Tax=Cyphomyrmex costatus TaxID=456900 RepID=A0A151IQ67_9HYME|nr:PREDICTED: ataxin-7-like protein 1 [Cyphomyrmex costatus]KYN08299.1 Ataxin-7-like protein 2 [Cyphomyrmex costatus]
MSGSDSPTFFHGQPWSSWIERIGRDKPLSDEETEVQRSSSVTRLSSDDIDLYGFCPERDDFYGVVCEICNSIVKPQALIQHIECRHSGMANFPPPTTPVTKPSIKTPFCKVSKLKRSTQPSVPSVPSSIPIIGSAKLNHTTVKRTADQANLSAGSSLPISSSPRSPLESITVQTTSSNIAGSSNIISVSTSSGGSPSKSPGPSSNSSSNQPRRKRLKTDRSLLKDREYDPDRHCGVLNEETGKPCTRSLTCKAHTVSLRRTVVGRSKTFDKLLAEHRAAKEQPNSGGSRQTTKVTVSGTVTVSSAVTAAAAAAAAATAVSNLNNPLAPNTPVPIADSETPSSPPVLSLPDTYPLPKAVDLLYRCLAPHGSTKPTKLEEDFVNSEELRNLESTLVVNSTIAGSSSSNSSSGSSQQQPSSMMAPISVLLPSLSPLPCTNSEESSGIATLIPSTTTTPTMPVVPAPLPTTCIQPPTVVATVLEGETPVDIDAETISMYSPIYTTKDTKSQLLMQIQSRPNSHSSQSPMSVRNYQQMQVSLPSLNLFEPVEQLEQQHISQINGKRLNHASSVSRQQKRHKSQHEQLCQSSQDFSTSASIQVEATTTSSPYPHFGDISWSNCHPEPLAVSRWLRISSSRKQYNFNIH